MSKSEIEFDTRELDLLIAAAAGTRPVAVDIVTSDPKLAVVAGVLEYGSKEDHRPWPRPRKRTVGKDGRVFSKQAPGGWVMKYAERFIGFLADAYQKAAQATGGVPLQSDLDAAAESAGKQTLAFLQKVVPVDSGQLKDSLRAEKAK